MQFTGVVAPILAAFREPAAMFLDPSRRVFGPYLLSALAITVAVVLRRGGSAREALGLLLSPKMWLHRSSRTDLGLIAAKSALGLLSQGTALVSRLALAGLTAAFLRRHLGDSPVSLSTVWAGLGFTLLAFAIEDWSRYAVHKLMHRVSWLWAFHKVHHAAEVLTPLTLYRTHPVETGLNTLRSAVTLGLVTGLWAWLAGPHFEAWQILGVDALGFGWNLTGASLRHSMVWVSFGRLERWLLSPAQHQVHHSISAAHRDKNFGTILSVWDRWGGSLYTTRETPEALTFGLGEGDRLHNAGVLGSLAIPFWESLSALMGGAPKAPRRWRPVASLAVASLVLGAGGCSDDTPVVDRAEVLRAMATCTTGVMTTFVDRATALATAAEALAAAPSEATLAPARAAWEAASDHWQEAEMLRYGPLGDLKALGGQGLRPQLYAWPDFNRCLVEQQLVARAYEAPSVAELSVSTRGLAALEYVLFYEGAENACAASEPLNAMGTWAALSPADRLGLRARAARALASDLATRARAVRTAWEPANYPNEFLRAGTGSTVYTTLQEALSAVAEATSYADTETKDLRLGAPLGITCTGASCIDRVESPFARRGVRNIRQNIVGLRTLLEGCPAGNNLGFDDLLRSAGAGALATTMAADLNAADQAAAALNSNDLRASIEADREAVVRLHAAVRELTSFLKMEFTTTLQIRSRRVEGDHD
ncbi:MAG: sterol desaturase family protein [Myxococcales bacterium]|nr:sterol desaturase family protein [Myxococcales bacterium]